MPTALDDLGFVPESETKADLSDLGFIPDKPALDYLGFVPDKKPEISSLDYAKNAIESAARGLFNYNPALSVIQVAGAADKAKSELIKAGADSIDSIAGDNLKLITDGARDIASVYDKAAEFVFKGVKKTRELGTATFPGDERLKESFFGSKVPEAIGQVAGQLLVAPTKLAQARPVATAIATGATQGFDNAYAEARDAGASEPKALVSGLLGAGIGASEALTLGKWIKKFGFESEQAARSIFQMSKEVTVDALKEGTQEFFQTMAGNAVAKAIYDKDREFFENAVESGEVGGVTGFIVSAVLNAATGRKVKTQAEQFSLEAAAQVGPATAQAEQENQIDGFTSQANSTTQNDPVEGLVRLYRVEPEPGASDNTPEWITDSEGGAELASARGRWFTDKSDFLDFYIKDIEYGGGKSQVYYLDVPIREAEKYRASNSPDVSKHSADPENEFFLPQELSSLKNPIKSDEGSQGEIRQGAEGVLPVDQGFQESTIIEPSEEVSVAASEKPQEDWRIAEGIRESADFGKAWIKGNIRIGKRTDGKYAIEDVSKGTGNYVAPLQTSLAKAKSVAEGLFPKPPTSMGPGAASQSEVLESDQYKKGVKSFVKRQVENPDLKGTPLGLEIDKIDKEYFVLTNKETVKEASGQLARLGIDGALAEISNPESQASPVEKQALGIATFESLNFIERRARESGDTEAADKALTQQIQVINSLDVAGRDYGRAIQIMRGRMTPQGWIRTAIKQAVVDPDKLTDQETGFIAEVKTKAEKIQVDPLIQKSPIQKSRSIRELTDFIEKQKGVTGTDILKSYWYSSILSGIRTQLVNVLGSGVQVQFNNSLLSADAARRREVGEISAIYKGWLDGVMSGIPAASDALFKGDFSGQPTFEAQKASNALEQIADSPSAFRRFLSNFKYVSRFMAAQDIISGSSAAGSRLRLQAYKTAKKANINSKDISEAIDEILHTTPEEIKDAKIEATSDGFKEGSASWKRRVNEILELKRPSDLMSEAKSYGLTAAYNNEPDQNTFLGWAAKNAETIMRNLENSKSTAGKIGGATLRSQIPFTRVVANVGNEQLNYTPIGLIRLARANKHLHEGATETDLTLLRSKIIFGNTAIIFLATMLFKWKDDEDPPFEITGPGPANPAKRSQWLTTNKPWSISWKDTKGKRHFLPYQYTPAAMMLAQLGAFNDSIKYGNVTEESALMKYAGASLSGLTILSDVSFLSSFTSLFDIISERKNPGTFIEKIFKQGSRTVGGLAPNLLKEIASYWWQEEPDVKSAPLKPAAIFLSQFPVTKQLASGKPMLNILGEEIKNPKYPWSRFYDSIEPTPLEMFLAKKQDEGVFISVPEAATKVLENGKRVTMNNTELYEYKKAYGQKMKELLSEFDFNTGTFRFEEFDKKPPEDSQKFIDGLEKDARSQAKEAMGWIK